MAADNNDDEVVDVKYACKIVNLLTINKDDILTIEREIANQNEVSSDNAVYLYKTVRRETEIFLFMELCNGLDLQTLLEIRGQITEKDARYIMSDVISGMKAVWEKGIIHRDLKPANIMLNFPGEKLMMTIEEKQEFLRHVDFSEVEFSAKIADFGLSRKPEAKGVKRMMSIAGSALYQAPQLLKKNSSSVSG